MALAGVDFCGWGAKQGSRVRSWKNRYFVLRGRELAYYGSAARDGSGVDEKGRVLVTGVEYAPDLRNGLLVRGSKRNQVLRMTTPDAAQSRALFRKIKEALGESQASFRMSAGASGRHLSDPPRKKSAPGFVPLRAVSKSVTGAVEVTREGWLLKEEPALQTWKRRYVTLSGNVLTYYSSPTAMALESDVVQQVSHDFASPQTLLVVAVGGRTVRLTGESRDDITDWGAAISRAIGTPVPALLTAHSWRDADVGGSDCSDRRVTCHIEEQSNSQRRRQYREGWLDKRGHKSGTWKQRYFLLADGLLEYRKHPAGEVCAENLVVDVRYSGDGAEALVISFASDSSCDENTVCVRASSAKETRRWMRALCEAVGKSELEPPSQQPQQSSLSASLTPISSASASEAGLSPLSPPPLALPVNDPSSSETQSPPVDRANEISRSSVQLGSHPVDQHASAVNLQARNGANSLGKPPEIMYRGWLLKKGQRFKTWKRRYFVLTRTTLVYYRTSNVKGAILGSGVVFDVVVGKERPFSLDVRFRNGRQLHIVAPTQEVFSMWHHVLRVSSNLTESFIQARRGSASADVEPVADEFDNDVEESENGGRDAEFTEEDIEEYQSQLGTGAQLWIAAMKDLPLSERKYSWSSLMDGKEPDPAVEPESAASSPPTADSTGDDATATHAPGSEVQGCRGWLMIEGDKLKSLQRRYCTLCGSTLSCYKSEKSPLLQSLVVTTVKDWESVPFALQVSGEGGAELVIAAQSNQEYQKWWRALCALTPDRRERSSDLKRALSGGQRTSPSGNTRSSSCSGWLEKEGRRFKTWKRRYFEFRNGALIYYSDVDGAVLGHGVVDHVSVDSYKYNTLNIELEHGRTLRVTAADKREMDRWMDALRSRASSSATAALSDASAADEGVGAASTPVADDKRLDSSDYFASDTITDESYRRIMALENNMSLAETMNEAGLSFKGELAFGERAAGSRVHEAEDACDDEEDSSEDAMDTTNGVEYLRALVDEEAMTKERRLAADEAREAGTPPVHSCAGGCCIVM